MRLAFRRAERTFTLAAESVLAAVAEPRIEPLFGVPRGVLGLLNWKGQLLGVLDPAPHADPLAPSVVLLTRDDDGALLALAADALLGLTASEHEALRTQQLLEALSAAPR